MTAFWQFGLVGVVAVAMATDLQNRKIYNWLTFPAMLAGLLLHVALGGLAGLETSLIGFGAGALIFVLGFLLGAMGAGDVKLMAAVGLWLGWPITLAAVLYVTVIGAILAVAVAIRTGALRQVLKNVWWFMVGLLMPGGKPEAAFQQSATVPVPYGVSIALGTVMALIFPDVNRFLQLFGLH